MLANFDLSGAEFVVVAYLCRDDNMLTLVKSGKSPHIVTGSLMSGLSESVIKADDDLITDKLSDPEEIAEARRTYLPEVLASRILPRKQSIRQLSKRTNHSGNYEIGYKEFALKFEIDEREAKKVLQLYSKVSYPGISTWWKSNAEQLRKTRTMTNCWGRKVYFMGQVNDEMFKAGHSFVPQSTVVDIVDMAMPKMLDDPSAIFRPARLLAQVHDSLLTDYLSNNFTDMAAFAIKLGLDYMRPVIDYGEPFFLNVDLKIGFDWRNMTKIKLTEDVDNLAEQFARAHDELRSKRAVVTVQPSQELAAPR